jgi:hypothetical protein
MVYGQLITISLSDSTETRAETNELFLLQFLKNELKFETDVNELKFQLFSPERSCKSEELTSCIFCFPVGCQSQFGLCSVCLRGSSVVYRVDVGRNN